MSKVLHPEVEFEPVGKNGYILASRARMALKRSGVSNEECDEFFSEALSGDRDHVIETIKKWVTVT